MEKLYYKRKNSRRIVVYTYNEKMSVYQGMSSTIALNLSSNYFPVFAISILGASNYQVGLISSLPPLIALIMTIPVAMILNRLQQKKNVIGYSILATRVCMLLMIGIAFLSPSYQTWAFLALLGFMNIPGTMANIGWQTFISEVVSENRRNHFFSSRNRLLTGVGMVTMLVAGIVMRKETNHAEAYYWLFFMAFCFGVIEVYYLFRHKEKEREEVIEVQKKKSMDWSIFKGKEYRWFLFAALWFNFTWQMAWSMFNIYHVKYVEASILWISLFAVGNQLAQVFSFSLWEKWGEKYGNAKMLVWVSLGMASTPFLTVLSENLIYLTIVQTVAGFFVSGVVLLLFNALLDHAPKEQRTYCITTYNVLLSFVAFLAPQIGIVLLEIMGMSDSMMLNAFLRATSAIVFLYMYRETLSKENRVPARVGS